jgi:hypothetical protein
MEGIFFPEIELHGDHDGLVYLHGHHLGGLGQFFRKVELDRSGCGGRKEKEGRKKEGFGEGRMANRTGPVLRHHI